MSYADGEMLYLLPGILREEIRKWQQETQKQNAASRAAWDKFLDLVWSRSAADWPDIQVVPRGVPRQEPKLGLLPIITRDETENHYGTSGDLDPRGYWMPIDGETS